MNTETTPALSIDSIKELMDGFDPAALLPELDTVFGKIELVCRIAVMIGPVLLLLLGLTYLFLAPKEANHYLGYRCYFGMGSVQAWRFTQKFSGIVLGVLGLVLTAVMVFMMMSFRGMAVEAMVWRAVKCLIWEAALALLANLAINGTVFFLFDSNGDFRSKKR
ncbi:MAG: SdpI family protein [Candidatus Faecousia sp.]|nr:SdpI family protein [Clostridiales bacterium]MDY6181667.1 SdpI family protein [Candidatus Faecousia sp.]